MVVSLEREILREMQQRILRSLLDILILTQLRKEPQSGYDVIVFTHKRFHILMSPGTAYSALYSLERDGLIQGNFVRRARVYTLTAKGRKNIQAFLDVNDKIKKFVTDFLRGLSE